MLDTTIGTLPVLGTLVVVLLSLYFFSVRRRPADGLPPGPQPLPFIGNVHQISLQHSELTFAKWDAQYGEFLILPLQRDGSKLMRYRRPHLRSYVLSSDPRPQLHRSRTRPPRQAEQDLLREVMVDYHR